MTPEKEAKIRSKIQELIEDFWTNYSTYKEGSEADIETKLIEPLFYALGWTKNDFDKRPKTGREGKRGIADYSFKINDRIVFYLEVKKIGILLDKEANKQAISYALSKRPTIPFAVSTNFEQLKVFCVEQENASQQTFVGFNKPEEYLSDFHNLLWLSKENFENGTTLQKAIDDGRLKKRMAIDKLLLEDLMQMRKLLVEDIEKNYSGNYDLNEKEEIVQRIIDRLIFIRRCEDVGINPKNMALTEVTELPHNQAYPKLMTFFQEYDKTYDSGLFAVGIDNDCDKIKIEGSIIKKLIEYLYESRDKQYYYNFDWIDADVLGQVYEQYLGKILEQTRSGKAKLKEGQAHRKEQGIYYTPTYVVDFIVKNTLGEILKDKKAKLKGLKILDPTCGSGSFLIKAFDYLYADLEDREESKQYKLDGQGSYSVKTAILKKNLYGVDLDNKAVEITKLNLLLKAAEKDRKLPEEIDLHIRHGNSLIDDETIDKNAFLWKNDFQVETFDVIIGNPPYVHQKGEKDAPKISFSERDYYRNNYKSVHLENSKSRGGIKLNLFVPYVETAIKLLKPNGRLGFIVHKNILKVESYKLLRKFILENCKIERIVDLGAGVFPEVTGETVIMVLQKNGGEMRNNSNEIKVIYDLKAPSDLLNEQGKIQKIKQDSFEHTVDNMFSIYVNKKMELLGVKLFLNSKKFGEVARIISFGLNTIDNKKFVSKTKTNQNFKHCLMGRDIGRYSIKNKSRFVLYDKKVLDRTGDEAAFNAKEKLIFQRIGAGIIGTYDAEKFYCFNSTNMILPKENGFPLKYMLGLLNSKLLNFYYRAFFSTESSLTVNVTQGYLSQLPIRNPTKSQESNVVQKVEKILLLNNRLSEIGEKNTAESKNLKDKIASISKEIDEEVYRLYEISGEEKKIIENRTI